MYSAYVLTKDSRNLLINRIGVKHSDIVAHHVTYRFGSNELPPEVSLVRVIGYAINDYVEAVRVEIPDVGTTRPDGESFHITVSVNRENGGKPVHSNKLMRGSVEMVEPFFLNVYPSVEK